jgi:Uma2 family endonuclease
MSVTTLVTAEQLIRMPKEARFELVAGELKPMSPVPGSIHCALTAFLAGILGLHVRKHKLGVVLSNDSGFLLERDPDTVLGPDLAFIRAERLAAQPLTEGYWPGAPDLAIEVRSPSTTRKEFRDRALALLAAGFPLLWMVDAASRTVTVYRSATDFETLSESAELEAPDILPGFRCPIADLFLNT